MAPALRTAAPRAWRASASPPDGWSLELFVGPALVAAGAAPEAVRVGLGGPVARSQVERGLELISHTLETKPETVVS